MTDTLDKPIEKAEGAAQDQGLTAAPKRLFIKTYGCQMNVYDSERMADVLRPLGYATTDAPEGADFVILNTCHIRERAAEKVYSELGKLKQMRERKLARGDGGMTIAATRPDHVGGQGVELLMRGEVGADALAARPRRAGQ